MKVKKRIKQEMNNRLRDRKQNHAIVMNPRSEFELRSDLEAREIYYHHVDRGVVFGMEIIIDTEEESFAILSYDELKERALKEANEKAKEIFNKYRIDDYRL